MTKPYVSVIIPVYNVEAYVSRCLNSVVQQTLTNIEIIVINDGSIDLSLEIVNRYAVEDSRIRVISQDNVGLSGARNAGLDVATGDYVAFVDSDDFIELDMLKSMYDVAIRDGADIVQCGVKRVDANDAVFEASQMLPPFTFEGILNGDINRAVWNKVYRRELFESRHVRYPVGLLHEDMFVTCQLYFLATRISWVNENFYVWFCRERSISQTISKKHIEDVFQNFRMLATFLESEGVMEEFDEKFVRGCFHYINALAYRINNNCRNADDKYRVLHALLYQRMNNFEYTGITKLEWLKAHDPFLYSSLYNRCFMIDDLHQMTNDELIAELKQARLELFNSNSGVKSHRSIVNHDFSVRLNRLYEWVKRYKKNCNRIALYGNSVAARLLAQEFGDSLVVVADQSAQSIEGMAYDLCLPDELQKYEFDCLLICVLGREDNISRYLVDVVGVDESKVHAFNLIDELPEDTDVTEDYKNLVERISSNQPIIGSHPLNVQIQTVSACNANCYFCPYVGSWHQQNPGRMEDDVFTRIVDQLSKYHIKKFCPYLENEPFLDKKLFDRVQYAIDVLKPEVVEISSNLSLLQVWHIEGLVNVLSKVPHELRISFHGIDKNSYENIMELDYEKSLANVKTVVAMMQEMPLNVMIRCSGEPRQSMKNNAHRWFGEEEFKQFWQHELADYKTLPVLDFFTYHDRAGQDQLKGKGIEFDAGRKSLKDFYCTRFDRWTHFLYTGEPVLCCMDYNRETVFSDSIKTKSIDDIYSSDAFVHLIKQGTGMVESKKDNICKRCISPGG